MIINSSCDPGGKIMINQLLPEVTSKCVESFLVLLNLAKKQTILLRNKPADRPTRVKTKSPWSLNRVDEGMKSKY